MKWKKHFCVTQALNARKAFIKTSGNQSLKVEEKEQLKLIASCREKVYNCFFTCYVLLAFEGCLHTDEEARAAYAFRS